MLGLFIGHTPTFDANMAVEPCSSATVGNTVVALEALNGIAVAQTTTSYQQPATQSLYSFDTTQPFRYLFSRGDNNATMNAGALTSFPADVPTGAPGYSEVLVANRLVKFYVSSIGLICPGQTIEIRDVSAGNAVIFTGVVTTTTPSSSGQGGPSSVPSFTCSTRANPTTAIAAGDMVYNQVPSATVGLLVPIGTGLWCHQFVLPDWATHILAIRSGDFDAVVTINRIRK